jgi:pimeloyl-ACP methyl ester carboxylesterase
MIRSIAVFAAALSACSAPPPFAGMVPTADGRMYAAVRGDGPDVVLVHGLGDSSVTWRKVVPEVVAAGHRVAVVDALGAGQSDKPEGPFGIAAHARRLATVLSQLQVERAVFVGNSLGGSVALRLAAMHPELVRALVLISPAAFPEGGWTGEWLWRVPGLRTALEHVPAAAVARIALQVNFGDPRRITAEDVATYTAEAARPGALAAFVRQQQQVMPTASEVAAWIAD